MLARGAEAVIERTAEGIRKERLPKGYRHPELDKQLREQRTKTEARLLAKAKKAGVAVPSVTTVDESTLLLEEIEGTLLRDLLDERPELAEVVGKHVATLHDAHIVHGDLTTSNMIANDDVWLIDFGLAFHSQRVEDKAVDLHVFHQALKSKHYKVLDKAWELFLKGYTPKERDAILERLVVVASRGRNKK